MGPLVQREVMSGTPLEGVVLELGPLSIIQVDGLVVETMGFSTRVGYGVETSGLVERFVLRTRLGNC